MDILDSKLIMFWRGGQKCIQRVHWTNFGKNLLPGNSIRSFFHHIWTLSKTSSALHRNFLARLSKPFYVSVKEHSEGVPFIWKKCQWVFGTLSQNLSALYRKFSSRRIKTAIYVSIRLFLVKLFFVETKIFFKSILGLPQCRAKFMQRRCQNRIIGVQVDVSRQSVLFWKDDFLESVLGHFQPRSIFSQRVCQNHFLLVYEEFLTEVSPWKIFVFSTILDHGRKTSGICQEGFCGVVKTSFCICLGTFWGKVFVLWRRHTLSF